MAKLILKGRELLERSGEINPHRLSLKVQMSSPTVHRYINLSSQVQALDLSVFPQLVMRALDINQDEFLDLKIGDLFMFETLEAPIT